MHTLFLKLISMKAHETMSKEMGDRLFERRWAR
jgi:hypothetical protein